MSKESFETKNANEEIIYSPKEIEKKWQKKWESSKSFLTRQDKKKKNCYLEIIKR